MTQRITPSFLGKLANPPPPPPWCILFTKEILNIVFRHLQATLGNKKKNILYVVGRYSSLAWLVSMLSGIQQYLP